MNRAFLHVIKTRQEPRNGALAVAARPRKRDLLSRFYAKVDPIQHGPVRVIAERHILQLDGPRSVWRKGRSPRTVRDGHLSFNDLPDAANAGAGPLEIVEANSRRRRPGRLRSKSR